MLIGIDASRAVTRQRTGTEAYALFLIQALLPLANEHGHVVRLYFNQQPQTGLFPQRADIEHVVIPFPRLWTHLRLARELMRRPPDLFFTPAHVIPLTFRGRSVATVHDLGYHHFPGAHGKVQLAYLRWSTRHNGRVSRRIVADSLATKQDLVKYDGVDPDRIDVIYPGVDPQLQPVAELAHLEAVQRRYHIKTPYLLYLGTLQPRKNLVRLIHAFAASQLPHTLVLAGRTGWLGQPILDAVAQLPPSVKDRVLLPGFIDDAHKAALLSGATALLFPSLYEGFGFPVLEAQACATAVLCANTSSLPEIAGDGALFVDPADGAAIASAIQRVASEEQLRQDLISRGSQNVKRFSWEAAAAQLLDTLERAAVS